MSVTRFLLQSIGGDVEGYWINLLGGASTDIFLATAEDSTGDVFVAGYTNSDGAGATDFLIARFSKDGTLVWDRTLGGSPSRGDRADALTFNSSNELVVAGQSSTGSGDGSVDAQLAVYNTSGAIQSQRRYTPAGGVFDVIWGVAVDSSDNILIAGNRIFGGDYGYVLKANSSGVIQWQKFIDTGGTSDRDRMRGVAVDSSDNVIVCGELDALTSGTGLAYIAKFDSSGSLVWSRRLASPSVFYGLDLDSSGNIICAGHSGTSALVAKYNSSGTIQWQKLLSSSANQDLFWSAAVDDNDNIICSGWSYNTTSSVNDALLIKLNSSGATLWSNTLGGSLASQSLGAAVTSGNDILFCGETSSDGAGGIDAFVARLPGDGSGAGTYGGLTYGAKVFTNTTSTLTDSIGGATIGNYDAVESTTTLTDAPAVLTQEFFPVTP